MGIATLRDVDDHQAEAVTSALAIPVGRQGLVLDNLPGARTYLPAMERTLMVDLDPAKDLRDPGGIIGDLGQGDTPGMAS